MIPPLLALLAWPLVAIVLFRTMRLPLAIIITILGGYLLLPSRTGVNLPVLPTFNKESVAVLTALVLAVVFGRGQQQADAPVGLLPRHRMAQVLLMLLIVGPLLTVMTNTDPIIYPTRRLQPLVYYDGFAMAMSGIMTILPLLAARKYLANPQSHRLLLTTICVAALGYSFLVLFEARMSPQLNNWVYGFFPHSWRQHIRGDGYRPVVFLGHGLLLGIFLACSVLAAAGLTRLDAGRRVQFLLATFWLVLALLISKNLGALLITLLLLPALFLFGVRLQLLVAALIAGAFLLYPVARSANILPLDQVIAVAERISPERALSFETRIFNEDRLMAKALERPFFGWGPWARSRVQNEQGEDISITDGTWVITLGLSGWAGYLARFGLLTLPILLLFRERRRQDIGMETSALALVLAANLLDLVPNSSLTPLTMLIAGSLWGRLELGAVTTHVPSPEERPNLSSYRRGGSALALARSAESTDDPAVSASQVSYTRQSHRIERRRPPSTEGAR
jgi:hypothetical protein